MKNQPSFLTKVKSFFVKDGQKSDDQLYSNSILFSNQEITTEVDDVVASFNYYYKMIGNISAVAKSLKEITQTIKSQKFTINNKKSEKEIENLPIVLASILEKPDTRLKYGEYISLMIKDLLISGNFFGYIIKDENNETKVRRIDPRQINMKSGEWIEELTNGREYLLNEDLLIHIKLEPDENIQFMGKGVVASNIELFRNMILALNFDKSFIKNGCNPSGVLIIKNNTGGMIKNDKLKEVLLSEHKGANETGNPLIIIGDGATWQQTQLDPATTKIPEKIESLSNKIKEAFGLPKYLIDVGKDSGQKYNNHELQLEHYIKYTVLPILDGIKSFFDDIIGRFIKDAEIVYNTSTEVYRDETLQKLSSDGTITRNEHRKFLNIPASEDEELDKHYVSNQLVAISDVGKQFEIQPQAPDKTPEEPEPEPEPEKPEKKIDRGQKRDISWRDKYYLSQPNDDIWTYTELKEKINKQRLIQDFETINQKTREKKFKEYGPKFLDYLTNQYVKIFKNMKKHESLLSSITGAKAENDIDSYLSKVIKVKDEQGLITELIQPIHQSVGSATFGNTANLLTVSIPFAMTDPGVASKVVLLREKTVLVAETTRNEIEAVVRRGIENSSTPAEVAKDMWRHFVDENLELPDRFTVSTVSGKRLNDRAVTIARNEIARANRLFASESMKKSGVVKSIQLVGLADADGTCTPYFNQNFPFEMEGELSNIHVNCRCTIVPGEINFD